MDKTRFLEIAAHIAECVKGTEFDGHVFAVGGCVRDMTMGNPIKDIDLCIDIPDGGIRLAEYMGKKNFVTGHPVTYPTYGTAMFRLNKFPNEEIECVQTRGEQYHDKDSRNPQVTFADMNEDCIRRDLTINALYMNVSTQEVIDPTGKGFQDINDCVCRVTNEKPDIVFTDDPLRILRVIRFACRYNFDIEDGTMEAMKRNADRLEIITQERVTDEFNKMMASKDPARALDLLRYCGAFKYVLPEMMPTFDMEQNKYHFGTVWEHTLKVVDNLRTPLFDGFDETWKRCIMIAAVLHDIGKLSTRSVDKDGDVHFYAHENAGVRLAAEAMMRMRYSNRDIEKASFLIGNHMRTKSWKEDIASGKQYGFNRLAYDCGDENRLKALLTLIHADNEAHMKDYCLPTNARQVYDRIMSTEAAKMFGYKLPIRGEDVMEALGIGPCEDVKHYLRHCLNLAFKNPGITREMCIYRITHDRVRKTYTGNEFKVLIDKIRRERRTNANG